ncbi:MAG: carbon starvation protein A [Pirellulales bacterium]|nr:carbon starvation protein A [Pirellulales bacterium]
MFHNAAVIALMAFAAFIVAYKTYGRFIASRVFRLDPNRRTPAFELEDGIDYVPSRVPVLFGHHFASIAGLGPILGPAIAVIWGWVPAVLWVVLGSIFIGAVHDLGALYVSLRYQGRSIGDVCGNLMGQRARFLALLIIFFVMSLAMGTFVNTISDLFISFNPDAIIPTFGLMAVAMAIGLSVYKFQMNLTFVTAAGLLVFAGLIVCGVERPVSTYDWFTPLETRAALEDAREAIVAEDVPVFKAPYGATAAKEHFAARGHVETVNQIDDAVNQARLAWISILLVYGFVASVLPVWLLLQPRDYINSFQLYFVLATMMIGLAVAAVTGAPESHIDAPVFQASVLKAPLEAGQTFETAPKAPSWLPLLFVTIACGAVSGFHSLVSSGTTVKQLKRETDALPIGYGAMLTEGVLAILVIMACVAGLGAKAWQPTGMYGSWEGASGLAAKLNAVVCGGGNFLGLLGIPAHYGRAVLAVTVVAFAMTTLDSATRLLRFNVEEMGRSLGQNWLANRYVASAVAVSGIAFFGLSKAGTALWVLFGSTNQLLAGLALLTVSVFLFKFRRPMRYTLIPMAIMLTLAGWALVEQLEGFWLRKNWSLVAVTVIVLVMSVWLVFEALLSFARGRGGLDFDGDGRIDVPAEP